VLDGPATSFQHSWVVTEQGSSSCCPRTSRQQAANLIHVAHPDARAALQEVARERHLLA
jgi:acyl-CoA hydrolase